MKYNVYIKEQDTNANWWYNVEEAQVKEIALGYHTKSSNFLLPGRGRIDFNKLENIAIYENEKNATDSDIEQILIGSGDVIGGVKRKKFRGLLYFGKDVSNLFLETGNFAGIKDWGIIHETIKLVAKKKYEDGHYADSVESALKAINKIIKEEYKKETGNNEDGDSLMRKAFTINKPIFKLADQSTENGRNIQQGYMDIFAGAMKGIRNPKAHDNLTVSPDEAWEMIILASHLMRMWDKRKSFMP